MTPRIKTTRFWAEFAPIVAIAFMTFSAGCAERVNESAEAPLSCTIRSKRTCELGKVPTITVAMKNQSGVEIYLVGGLDGSDQKLRYPHCYFEVTGPDGKSAVQELSRWCGNINPLREKEFVKVLPGGTFDPYLRIDESAFWSAHQLDASTFRKLGEYRIQFVYSTECDSLAEWCGDGRVTAAKDEKLLSLFRRVPKVVVKSNAIMVTIVESKSVSREARRRNSAP